MEVASAKFREDMNHFRQELFSSLGKIKEDLQEQISDNSNFLNDLSKNLSTEISEVRLIATEQVKTMNKDIVDKFSGQFS